MRVGEERVCGSGAGRLVAVNYKKNNNVEKSVMERGGVGGGSEV